MGAEASPGPLQTAGLCRVEGDQRVRMGSGLLRLLLLRIAALVAVLGRQALDLDALAGQEFKVEPANVLHRRALGQEISSWQGDRFHRRQGTDASGEYFGVVLRDTLKILAAGRRRLPDNAPPKPDLTAEEIERSTGTAMRLAEASRSQAEARASADTTRPT